MTDPIKQLQAGMSFMDMKSAMDAMEKEAVRIGGTVTRGGDGFVLKNKQGKVIANVFQYTINGETTYRYNDSKGREYVGKNTHGENKQGKFTKIFSGDGKYVANDKNRDGKVSENEIDINW